MSESGQSLCDRRCREAPACAFQDAHVVRDYCYAHVEYTASGASDKLVPLRAEGFLRWADGKAALDARAGVADWVLHDIRRTVATRMADLGVAPHVIEAILNHQSGHKSGIAGTYNRSSYANETRAALALWADHVTALVSGRPRKIAAMRWAARAA
jgi:integrase